MDILSGNGDKLATVVKVPFHHQTAKRSAQFVFVTGEKSGKVITGAGTWADSLPDEVAVFDVVTGKVMQTATLQKHNDGSQTVAWTNGKKTFIPPLPHLQKTGSNSLPSTSLVEPTDWSCQDICHEVCHWVFVVECAVVAVLVCLPCDVVIVCAIICAVVVAVVCAVAEHNVCEFVCETICGP